MARTARVVAFSTTPEMADAIDRLASEANKSRSEILRCAFAQYVAGRQAGVESSLPRGIATAEESTSGHSSSTVEACPPVAGVLPGLALVLANREAIRELCRALMVRRLWVFGSAVRADFEPARSDLDFQVEFEPDAVRKPWAADIFELRTGLASILKRTVDLGESGRIENPYVRASIEAERLCIYDATE